MTDEELRALVERNALAVEKLERKTEQIDRQIELLTRQVQVMAPAVSSNGERLLSAERHIQGIYDLLGTLAKEQADRSKLIDQQIQALIDERRRS